MSFSFTGKAAIVAAIVFAVVGILCWQNPEVLSWLLGTFLYQGPR